MMPPVYMLGCKEFADRNEATIAHLKSCGIDPIFFRSIYGSGWGLQTTKEFDTGKHIPPGHVGLNLGIWSLWNHLYHHLKNDDDEAIIFEDDVRLVDDFDVQFQTLRIELNYYCKDWDFVFLGLAERVPSVWNKITERIGPPNSRICRIDNPFGTHATWIRKRALPILMDNMAFAERNLDQQLYKYVLKPNLLKWCAVLPTLVYQRTFDHNAMGKPEWKPTTLAKLDTKTTEQESIEVDPTGDLPGRPSAERLQRTYALTDPFPCIYRGEPLERIGKASNGKTIPLWQCALYNTACHTKAKVELDHVIACETCETRKGMKYPTTKRERLDLPEGHFNPSIAVWNGKLILATRDSWGHSKVGLWELNNTKTDWTGEWKIKPIGSFASEHSEAGKLEDPRLFIAPNPDSSQLSLCAMFNIPDRHPPKYVRVGYVRFKNDLSGIESTEIFPSPNNNLYEKNWVPFWCEHTSDLHWVYSTKPKHLVMGQTNWETPNYLPWTGGVIRGGAAPLLREVNGRPTYYHFFHGALKRISGTIYTVGVCTFEQAPPFRVMKQTPTPILWPDLPAADEDVQKRYVVWPGGVVEFDNHYFIALGIDDTYCRIHRVSVDEVEKALKDLPESEDERTVSLRDTVVATGTSEEEAYGNHR